MLNSLLSVFGVKSSILFPSEIEKVECCSIIKVRCNTSRLPENFRRKFRIGEYRINESDGDIRINYCQMELNDQRKFMDVVQERQFFRCHEKEEKSLDFWRDFTSNHGEAVIYLEVGGGTYFNQDLFERLIIVHKGNVVQNLKHHYRGFLSFRKDDTNIQAKLAESIQWGEDFQMGKVKVFVYHKLCHSLTSLYFDRHDEDVSTLDSKRALFFKYKYATVFSIKAGIFFGIWHMVNNIFPLGPTLSPLIILAGMGYLAYQHFPEKIKKIIKEKSKY